MHWSLKLDTIPTLIHYHHTNLAASFQYHHTTDPYSFGGKEVSYLLIVDLCYSNRHSKADVFILFSLFHETGAWNENLSNDPSSHKSQNYDIYLNSSCVA